MADSESGRRAVLAAVSMVIVAQVLAIANDVILRMSDPSDVVLLVLLVILSFFVLRRAPWARWTVVVLVTLGGLLESAGAVLLIVTRSAPRFWPAVSSAIPALAALRAPVIAFATSHAFALLLGSLVISALFDLCAALMLAFAPSMRSYFARDTRVSSA